MASTGEHAEEYREDVVRSIVGVTSVISIVSSLAVLRAFIAEWNIRVSVSRREAEQSPNKVIRRALSGFYQMLVCVTIGNLGSAIAWLLSIGVPPNTPRTNPPPTCLVQAHMLAWFPVANAMFSVAVAAEAAFSLLAAQYVVTRKLPGLPMSTKWVVGLLSVLIPSACTIILVASKESKPQFQGIWCWYDGVDPDNGGPRSSSLWPFWLVYGPRLAAFVLIVFILVAVWIRVRGERGVRVGCGQLLFLFGFPLAFALTTIFLMLARIGNHYLDLTQKVPAGGFAALVVAALFTPSEGTLTLFVLMSHRATREVMWAALLSDVATVGSWFCCGRCDSSLPRRSTLKDHLSLSDSSESATGRRRRQDGDGLRTGLLHDDQTSDAHTKDTEDDAMMPGSAFAGGVAADSGGSHPLEMGGVSGFLFTPSSQDGPPGSLASSQGIFAGSFYGGSTLLQGAGPSIERVSDPSGDLSSGRAPSRPQTDAASKPSPGFSRFISGHDLGS